MERSNMPDDEEYAKRTNYMCPTHHTPLEKYTIEGGVWLGEGKGFDTTPQVHYICPKCENMEG